MDTPIKYQGLQPMFRTDKLDETIEFYTSVLGFLLMEKNDDWQWACLQKDGIEIMLAKPNEHMPFEKAVFTGSIYIITNNADLLWNNLKEKVTVCYGIENFDWGMRELPSLTIMGIYCSLARKSACKVALAYLCRFILITVYVDVFHQQIF